MKIILKGKSYWDIIEDGYIKPNYWNDLSTNMRKEAKEKKENLLVLDFIQADLKKSLFP